MNSRTVLLGVSIIALAPLTLRSPAHEAWQQSQPARTIEAGRTHRAALAAAYIRLDRLMARHPPEGARLADINKEFDSASLLFFENRLDEAAKRVEQLADSLEPAESSSAPTSRAATTHGLSRNAVRKANAIRLDDVERAALVRTQAIEVCKARNRLLTDSPSPDISAQFLADQNVLEREVAEEIASLERGEDPYIKRAGDLWRTLVRDREVLPMRVYVPDTTDWEVPRPLVIALHGAGGDENMFPEAYGAGKIKSLADLHGFIVVSPLTYPLAGDATLLDAVIDEMSLCYAVDRERIYLIGHSLGAGAAAGLSRIRSDVIAATCCIAGGGIPRDQSSPPTLVIAAELDGLAGGATAAERGAIVAAKAQRDGVNVEYRIMQNWGHTLVVGAVLPEAVDWLLSHSRRDSAPESQPTRQPHDVLPESEQPR